MGCKKFGIVLVNALLIVSLLLSSVSCSKKQSNNELETVGDRTSYYYSAKAVDLHIDDMYSQVYNVIPYNGYYYAIVQGNTLETVELHSYLYCIDEEGQIVSNIELNSDLNHFVSSDIVSDELIYVTFSNKLEKANINTGEITYSEQTRMDLCGAVACDDGYVVMSVGRLDKYDVNNNLTSTIENPDWLFFNGYKTFYESDGSYYLLPDNGFYWKYYRLNFDDSTSELIYDPTQVESGIFECNGQYLFNDDGEYLMDLDNSRMVPIAKWDGMDLQPAKYSLTDPNYIGIDNETFIQVYNYGGFTSQIVIYTYEPDMNYSERTEIVVGGYNCKDDLTLKLAIYKYNTSQTGYRIVIDDYSDRFGWDSYEGAATQKAALIQYFNNGNAPDIFFGKFIDFNMLANNGDLLDIKEYMTDDIRAVYDKITPSIKALMEDNEGRCYNLFAGYQLYGYISSLDVEADLSIEDTIKYANEYGVTMNSGEIALQIVSDAIQYSILNGELYSVEELEEILSYAFEYGFYDFDSTTFAQMDSITVNDYLLWSSGMASFYYMMGTVENCRTSFTYVGYPTIGGSKHVILPFGQVGVSSATSYPEECTKFVSGLIDGDVQNFCNFCCFNPVNDSYLKKMINYGKDISIIPEEDYQYYYYWYLAYKATDETAENFYSAIESVDTVCYYDWGVENIIYNEVQSYYTDSKPIHEIAAALYSRLSLYLDENS